MKKGLLLLVVILVMGFSGPVSATLWDRGGGLIYDDELKITWLQDANYAKTSGYHADGYMHWADAMKWTDDLVYEGYDDWRLPVAPDNGGSHRGEMGHLFDSYHIPGTPSPFINFAGPLYWSSTEGVPTDYVYTFMFDIEGTVWGILKDGHCNAFAVRDGDSHPVPEPITMLLFGFGLVGLAGLRRKIKK